MNPHYDSITSYVDGMIAKVDSHPDWIREHGHTQDISLWLKDFKTIGYSPPRQCGGAFWLHHQFLQHPDALLITLNETTKTGVRDSFTRDGEYVGPNSVAKHDPRDIGISAVTAQRILTHAQFADLIKSDVDDGPFAPDPRAWKWAGVKPTRIYIEYSEKFFKQCRSKKFYDYLTKYVFPDGNGWIIKHA